MKVCLLNPPGPVLKAGTRWSSKIKGASIDLRYYPFPVYLAYAAAVLREAGHEVAAWDAVALEWDDERTLASIREFGPDILAVETSTTSFYSDLAFLEALDVPKVAVGSHATGNALTCLREGYDYVVAGEYEMPLRDLVRYLTKGGELPAAAASAKDPRQPVAFWLEDLDCLPWPARDLLPIERYNEPVAGGRNIVLVSGRGCNLRCRFCTVPVFQGGSHWRARDPVKVVDEVEHLLKEYSYDELYFDDDNLTVRPAHVRGLCREIKKRGLKFRWGCMGDAFLDTSVIAEMADAGCVLYKFGVEHNDREVLRRIPKAIKEDQVRSIIEECRRHGVRSHATFVVGLPGSSVEKDMAMVEYSLALRPTTLQYSVYSPFPGTPAYEEAQREGWLVSEDWSKIDGAGRSIVSYPDYHWTQITKMNCYAWDRWGRHFLLTQPGTSWHHFRGIMRREGLKAAVTTSVRAAAKILRSASSKDTLPTASMLPSGQGVAIEVCGAADGTVNVAPGSNLLQALVGGKMPIWHHCGGAGRCATCAVEIVEGIENLSGPTAIEHDKLTAEELAAGVRLACQTKVNGNCRVRIPEGIGDGA